MGLIVAVLVLTVDALYLWYVGFAKGRRVTFRGECHS